MNTLLTSADLFVDRHIGPAQAEWETMAQEIGYSSLNELIAQVVPGGIRLSEPLTLETPLTEAEYLASFRQIMSQNIVASSYIGMGYYNCVTPPVIQRGLLENPGWYTQYTPYQAEIAQGRLESLLNFQTMVTDLTGMEIANASLLDEATAAAEAMNLMHNARSKSLKAVDANILFVSDKCFPQTIDVLITRAEPLGLEIVVGDHRSLELGDEWNSKIFGIILQYPASDGAIFDYAPLIKKAHDNEAKVTVCADLLALTLLTPPGELGADIAVGSAQRFGVPLGYGGPHAAYFATKDEFKRDLPGRIIGVSKDAQGNNALRMALQTREQHIRREKATSNICTAQALLANIAAMYAVYHGPERLKAIARRVHGFTRLLATAFNAMGLHTASEHYFDTLTISLTAEQLNVLRTTAEARNINFYYHNNAVSLSLDETVGHKEAQAIADTFSGALQLPQQDLSALQATAALDFSVPESLQRTSAFLTHPVFNAYHSETELMRYMKRLENKDLSLVHSMIALGSCTMKLNAAVEMMPVTWREVGGLHPFAPAAQTKGYQQMLTTLERWLQKVTGFAAVSLQPNAGAQGEYAGLLVIRAYLQAKGETQRNVALIPSSAHGTNPASAVMAGMKVVVVKSDERGYVDIADLRAKAEEYKDTLAALMVTYPSTHGVFEETIKEVCEIVHQHGGQVYMDGANMNAQVGLTSPFEIGADVCHLNLHKTFCIPHGGGGPGMGPIGVREHLAPFLPGHAVVTTGGNQAIRAVSAAPWGSASILPISYGYIAMMGGEGLTNATKVAILNANYIAWKLKEHFPILYTSSTGLIAHELILDMRSFKQSAGVEVEDIAKRLMDYGFHAPTVSFPVPGTMMIEPTESESKAELDRFCEAMIAIRAEIQEIADGKADKADNVLKHAPHTLAVITADEWTRPYSRQKAAYPLAWVAERKFWPSVSRINNTLGDRVLICTCLPIESYAETAEQA